MPNRKLTKEENQPSIKTLLPNRTEGVECINVDQESANSTIDVNNINSNSTQKLCTYKDYGSPAPTADQTLNDTELTEFKAVKSVKKEKGKVDQVEAPKINQKRRSTFQKLVTWMAKDPSPITPSPQIPCKQTQKCP